MSEPHPPEHADVVIVGAGAAGLMAAISAGRELRAARPASPLRLLALDGARTLGAKILVAGGGRCNVTHHHVDETAYAGSSRNAIKKVLRAFPAEATVAFFRELGVELKREDTGKLFPVSDSARTVLEALLRAARDAGVELRHPWLVDRIESADSAFLIHSSGDAAPIRARAVILATGGRSLPKSGSDGHGYALAQSLGHTITPRIFPALVPLVLDVNKTLLHELSGITIEAELVLLSSTGRRLQSFRNSLLFTHFGLSGPAALDISRYLTSARLDDPGASLRLNLLPEGMTYDSADALLSPSGPLARVGAARGLTEAFALPDRLARAICETVSIPASTPLSQLSRDQRRSIAHQLASMPLPVVGDRGYAHAEVTAGGVPLSELHLDSMRSRCDPHLFLCGEICDVDGRIGGFNFQWAWASGFIAGAGAVRSLIGLLVDSPTHPSQG